MLKENIICSNKRNALYRNNNEYVNSFAVKVYKTKCRVRVMVFNANYLQTRSGKNIIETTPDVSKHHLTRSKLLVSKISTRPSYTVVLFFLNKKKITNFCY